MKLISNYIDSQIVFNNDFINTIEIENKNYFYRIINDLFLLNNFGVIDSVSFVDDDFKEINMISKFNICIDYFNFDFSSRKNILYLCKNIKESIDEKENLKLQKNYKDIIKIIGKSLNDIDIDISIDNEFDIENLLKLLKIQINIKNNILDNILLLFDIEKLLQLDRIVVFVNLKQYLTKTELIEVYKYSIYNNIKIMLVDSQSYGVCLEYEKKLVIDDNLNEYMI